MNQLSIKREFRQLSREIKQQPTAKELHEKRIELALHFSESEPLQGALADYFYGCWFNVPFFAEEILLQTKFKLRANVFKSFYTIVLESSYLPKVNKLATGWSVLATPSLEVSSYRLKTSVDYSTSKVDTVTEKLTNAKLVNDKASIINIENEFFAYCLACEDCLAFMKIWFQLAKQGWEFDTRWETTRQKIELISKAD